MIERLVGTCAHKHATGIVLDVAGVGYAVEMTPTALAKVAEDAPMTAWIHTHVTQDAFRLFGFATLVERQIFTLLLSASGLGPRIALAILARFDPSTLFSAIDREDSDLLEEVPGIGPRQSKKFILELKPKFAKLAQSGILLPAAGAVASVRGGASARTGLDVATLRDLKSALENFGYKERELAVVLRKFERTPPATGLAELIKHALADLTGAGREDAARAVEELF